MFEKTLVRPKRHRAEQLWPNNFLSICSLRALAIIGFRLLYGLAVRALILLPWCTVQRAQRARHVGRRCREMLERSTSAQCPSVAYQLAGAKKVQQDLAAPGVLEGFLEQPDQSRLLRACFAGDMPFLGRCLTHLPCCTCCRSTASVCSLRQ